MGDTCVIKKTMCPPGYNHSDILITHELGQMIYMMYTEFSHCISEPVGKVIYMCMCLRVCIYVYDIHFTIDRFFEVAIESWPEWNLNPRPLNSVQTL